MNEKKEHFQGNGDFSKLVKKARRRSLLKTIIVSVLASAVLFTALFGLGTYLLYERMEDEVDYDYAWNSVRGANVETNGSLYNYTPFSAAVTTESTKFIANVPVPWMKQEKVFSIFGSSRIVQTNAVSGTGSIDDERIPMYFQGERVIEFYHPDAYDGFLPDERPLLNEISDGQVVEMAFSFDRAYSIVEVEEQFADVINWYWVDTFAPSGEPTEEIVLGDNAYGFHQWRDAEESAEGFLRQMEWLVDEKGDGQEEAKQLLEGIGTGEAGELKIIGAVVTGTPEELMEFNELPMIRAAVLGVTVDRY